MSKLSGTWNGGFEASTPSIWKYTIYVLFSLVIIIAVGKFAFNSAERKSNLVRKEKAAIKVYQQYTQELEAISKKYADKSEAN
jgi:uncharacterized protein YpmS